MREKLYRFMSGRNGVDDLARVHSWIVLILLLLAIFTKIGLFSILAFALLIYMYFRVFQKTQPSGMKRIRSISIFGTIGRCRGTVLRSVWHRAGITVFLNVPHVSSRCVCRRDMERLRLPARSAGKPLFAERKEERICLDISM